MYKVLVVLVVFAIVCLGNGEEYFAGKYDNLNLDEILANDRLLQGYCNCLQEKGKCTPEGADLKSVLKEALESNCAKCSDKQREGAKKVLKHLIEKKKDCYDPLAAKYDPDGKHRKEYDEEAKKEGIKL